MDRATTRTPPNDDFIAARHLSRRDLVRGVEHRAGGPGRISAPIRVPAVVENGRLFGEDQRRPRLEDRRGLGARAPIGAHSVAYLRTGALGLEQLISESFEGQRT